MATPTTKKPKKRAAKRPPAARKPATLELPPEGFRQSLLAGFETCGRRTRFALQTKGDWATGYVEVSADLGKMFHLFARDYLRILYKTGHENMPPNDAVEVMKNSYEHAGFVLPADEREDLVWLVRGFAHFKWPAIQITALEERLQSGVTGSDGVTRIITGQPDVVMTDPPNGIVIVDYKTGRTRPPSPKGQRDAEYAEGRKYLSPGGHFQLDTYGMLALHDTPAADYVILRELHLRSGQVREATLRRDELQYVEDELGRHAMLLAQAIDAGPKSPLFAPRAGGHCARRCPVSRSCPIPREQRGVGAISTDRQAEQAASALVVAKAQVELISKQLKNRFEATGFVAKLTTGEEVRWYENGQGGRSFGVCDEGKPMDPKSLQRLAEIEALKDQDDNMEDLLAESIRLAEEAKGEAA